MSKPPSLVFVRHAYTEWNLSKLTMGQTNVPATESAICEAKEVAKNYESKPSWIVSSPLKRAVVTARAFSERAKLPLSIDPLWMERYWGPFEGHPKSKRDDQDRLEGVEEYDKFLDRVYRGLTALPEFGEGMVVSHAGVYRALISLGYQSNYSAKSLRHSLPIILSLKS